METQESVCFARECSGPASKCRGVAVFQAWPHNDMMASMRALVNDESV